MLALQIKADALSLGGLPHLLCVSAARSGQRKLLHMLLNAFAVLAALFGVIAAFRSHTLKRPVPTPNLYSPHSYLGLLTLIMLGAQVGAPTCHRLHSLVMHLEGCTHDCCNWSISKTVQFPRPMLGVLCCCGPSSSALHVRGQQGKF